MTKLRTISRLCRVWVRSLVKCSGSSMTNAVRAPISLLYPTFSRYTLVSLILRRELICCQAPEEIYLNK
eukprot:3874448-Pyramimonas_sp.AAC.1